MRQQDSARRAAGSLYYIWCGYSLSYSGCRGDKNTFGGETRAHRHTGSRRNRRIGGSAALNRLGRSRNHGYSGHDLCTSYPRPRFGIRRLPAVKRFYKLMARSASMLSYFCGHIPFCHSFVVTCYSPAAQNRSKYLAHWKQKVGHHHRFMTQTKPAHFGRWYRHAEQSHQL